MIKRTTLNFLDALVSDEVQLSRFTIRVKLLFIITGILVFALLFMNFAATYLFKKMSATLIQEYNLSLARMNGSKVDKSLRDISYQLELISNSGIGFQEKALEFFFKKNKEIYGISSWNQTEGKWNLKEIYLHAPNLTDTGLDASKLSEINQSIFDKDERIENVTELRNLYSAANIPLLGYIIPIGQKDKLIVYLNGHSLLQSFLNDRQTEIFEMFLVDSKGELILHSSPQNTESTRDLPIVKRLLESKVDNGSAIYNWKEQEYLGSYYLIGLGGIGVVSNVPSDRAFEAVYLIQKQNFLLLCIVFLVAFLIVFVFAKTLSVPIVKLVNATKQIEKGDFHITIQPNSNDEIGVLTSSFSRMAKGLWEKEQIKGAFGKFVNPEIVKRALSGSVELGGEYKVCTVFFSDIRNFTNMSERMEPGEVVDILNRYFTEMVKCVHDTGGVVDKFIGDAVMAHWGSLVHLDNPSKQSVRAALRMRRALISLNKEFELEGKPKIRIGCGINTGPVIAGQIGSEERLEFTVIGDAVNLASRIEYLNKHFGTDILISESCFQHLEDEFSCLKMPKVMVKGKESAQIVYAVLGEKNSSDTPASLDELRGRLGIPYSPKEQAESIKQSTDTIVEKKGSAK
jgi:adenylate cyclase